MKTKVVAALAVSGAQFLGFVFLALQGNGGAAAMLAGSSIFTLLFMGMSMRDEEQLESLLKKSRTEVLSHIKAGLFLGKIAKRAVAGEIEKDSILVEAETISKDVTETIKAVTVNLRAKGLTEEGRNILRTIMSEVNLDGYSAAGGVDYAKKEYSKVSQG